MILMTMEDGKDHKTAEIAHILGLKSSYTRDLLNELVKKGNLEVKGFNRNRVYRMKMTDKMETRYVEEPRNKASLNEQ